MESERITGLALLADASDGSSGGTVILVPGSLEIDGMPLDQYGPDRAVSALGSALRLRITSTEVMTPDRWEQVLGDRAFELPNPDPVLDDRQRPLLTVGPTEIDGSNAAIFLGRPAPGTDPITLTLRRQLFWSALVADPPRLPTTDSFIRTLSEISGPAAQVVDLPLLAVEAQPRPDLEAIESLIREVVPVPAGANPGDRLQVRVIDRTGLADLPAIAATVASTGSEVVEIGNALEFDGGLTHLVVPSGLEDPGINELALLTGATTVHDDEVDTDPVVTLLIGSDFVASR